MSSTGPRHVWEHYVRAEAAVVWAILTDDSKTPLWHHFDMSSRTEWRAGGGIAFFIGDQPAIVGKMVEIDPPRRFVHTFRALWAPDVAGDPASQVTWQIERLGPGTCKIVLTHDAFGGHTATANAVTGGWPEALSRLKTLAETGTPFRLPVPSSAAG